MGWTFRNYTDVENDPCSPSVKLRPSFKDSFNTVTARQTLCTVCMQNYISNKLFITNDKALTFPVVAKGGVVCFEYPGLF